MTAPDRQAMSGGLPAVARTGTAVAMVPAQLREIAEAAGVDDAMIVDEVREMSRKLDRKLVDMFEQVAARALEAAGTPS